MLVFDRLLASGLRFVFDKVATIADAERNDVERIREDLLATQLAFEDGRIDEPTFRARETELITRLREIRDAQHAENPGEIRVTGVEANFETTERVASLPVKPRARTAKRTGSKTTKKSRSSRKT